MQANKMILRRALNLLFSAWRLSFIRMSKRLKLFNLQASIQLSIDSLLKKKDKILVIDCGATIGQSVISFRKLFGKGIVWK
jgi:hypothetical protein